MKTRVRIVVDVQANGVWRETASTYDEFTYEGIEQADYHAAKAASVLREQKERT